MGVLGYILLIFIVGVMLKIYFESDAFNLRCIISDYDGNKYNIDGTRQDTLSLSEGTTYKFDQSDPSNATNNGHPLRFSTTPNGTHESGIVYNTGVTTNGTLGTSEAYTQITVAVGAPTLYYYCTNHSGMGGMITILNQ